MPELPEVETIRRQLAPLVEGRRLERVEILDPRWSRPLSPAELSDALEGRRVERLDRRGKYLLWSFDDDVHLAQHLRMTGAVLSLPGSDPAAGEPPHTRVRLVLGPVEPSPGRHGDRGRSSAVHGVGASSAAGQAAGQRLAIVDPRRFGTGELLIGCKQLEEFFAKRLGLE